MDEFRAKDTIQNRSTVTVMIIFLKHYTTQSKNMVHPTRVLGQRPRRRRKGIPWRYHRGHIFDDWDEQYSSPSPRRERHTIVEFPDSNKIRHRKSSKVSSTTDPETEEDSTLDTRSSKSRPTVSESPNAVTATKESLKVPHTVLTRPNVWIALLVGLVGFVWVYKQRQ